MTYKKRSSCNTVNSVNQNANAIKKLNAEVDFGDEIILDFNKLSDDLSSSCAKIRDDNDPSELVDMLTCQTHTLQNLFTRIIGMTVREENVEHINLLAGIAMKSQSQCRATILAIAEIKNPKRATFIKQQTNQSLGHMQINNSKQSEQDNLSKISNNPPNKLLEQQHGERLDFGTAKETVGINQKLETVGKVNRGKKRDR